MAFDKVIFDELSNWLFKGFSFCSCLSVGTVHVFGRLGFEIKENYFWKQ